MQLKLKGVNDFRAVFMREEGKWDTFVILKNGECLFEHKRYVVIFKQKIALTLGDLVEITRADDNDKYEVPEAYFVVRKVYESSEEQRFENLKKATVCFIENAYTTSDELTEEMEEDGIRFAESAYFDEIVHWLGAFIHYYDTLAIKTDKIESAKAQTVSAVQDFWNSSLHNLGREPDHYDTFASVAGYIKNIREQYFAKFTPVKKVVEKMHELIKKDALSTLARIQIIYNMSKI